MIMLDKNCYEANASSGTYRYVKRSIDIIGSLLVLVAFSFTCLFDLVGLDQEQGRRTSIFCPRKNRQKWPAF